MRTDQQLSDAIAGSEEWARDPVTGRTGTTLQRFQIQSLDRAKMSFSGHEKNHLFANTSGEFIDISGVSGLDSDQDSRTLAFLDLDRDGQQDIVSLNINGPVIGLYHNRFQSEQPNHFLAVRLVGGNTTSNPNSEFGCRDGFGAKIEVRLSGRTLVREHRCGEGLAAQNSNTLLFGMGQEKTATITVRWPSGKVQSLPNVNAGSLVQVFEDKTQSLDGSGFNLQTYRPNEAR